MFITVKLYNLHQSTYFFRIAVHIISIISTLRGNPRQLSQAQEQGERFENHSDRLRERERLPIFEVSWSAWLVGYCQRQDFWVCVTTKPKAVVQAKDTSGLCLGMFWVLKDETLIPVVSGTFTSPLVFYL